MKKITARQQEIIAAALELVAEHGPEALTIKGIAARVGFSDAAVYRHFRNKAQILSTIIDIFARDSARLLAEIHGCSCPAPEKLRLFFLDRCRVFSGDRVLATIMFAENLFQNDPALAAKVHKVMQGHRRLLMAAIRNGQRQNSLRRLPAEHLFTVVMGSLRLLVLQWRIGGCGFDLMRAGEKLWRSLATLILPPSGE
ncbi:MAG: TetR/AcrR family transcriptional regulator [Acidobacteriota bacterium]|jgi:AcrR family transcriptional regulator|nr:TetR/AcrR family transcriptional regulator [Acidobacteriota bacterium]